MPAISENLKKRHWVSAFSLLLAMPAAYAGSVDFVPYYESGTDWTDLGATSAGYQSAMDNMLGQFESALSGMNSGTTTIEVFFTDDADRGNAWDPYGSASTGSYHTVDLAGHAGAGIAANSWVQLVLGGADPNGAIAVDSENANRYENYDIIVNWNFAKSAPSSNIGLLRHEMMHGLGMFSTSDTRNIDGTWYSQSLNLTRAITTDGAGTIQTETITYDRSYYNGSGWIAETLSGNGAGTLFQRISPHMERMRDANGDALFAWDEDSGNWVLQDYAVDTLWGDNVADGSPVDHDESGVYYEGGDGEIMYISTKVENYANDNGPYADMEDLELTDGASEWSLDFSHVVGAYANERDGEWSLVNDLDKAYLKGLGYTVVPEPASLGFLGLGGLAMLRRRRRRC